MRNRLFIFGLVLFTVSGLIFGIMHAAFSLYASQLNGWSDPPGKLTTILNDSVGWVPYIISILFMVSGMYMICYIIIKDKSKA
ncbi:hypothetical protein SAMN04488137_1616 [Fictibacillus solisalsi]|uniref:Menaquinol-cytochrome c reductase cytochrome b subunit n=1 Tax=Fictibacillus solisalsi TaxID=459525 RepID=A0A1G9VJW8_9BACL|nr:hypothetical protein SAMN04488137_1616 [Fictibacillus solisalsi]